MAILRKIPWTRQPPAHVGINRAHPLCAGLKAVFSFHRGYPYEEITGAVGALEVGATIVPTDMGLALQCGLNVLDACIFPADTRWRISTKSTHAVLAKNRKGLIAGTGSEVPFGAFGGGDDEFRVLWQQSEDFTYTAADIGPSNIGDDIIDGLRTGVGTEPRQWNMLGGYWDGSLVTARINYVVSSAPDSESGTQANVSQDVALGNTQTASNASWDGWVALGVILGRDWSQGEWDSFVRNPWQIFEPRTQIIPIGVTSGGPVITDVNTTESWDDGDTGLVITGTGFV